MSKKEVDREAWRRAGPAVLWGEQEEGAWRSGMSKRVPQQAMEQIRTGGNQRGDQGW